MTSETPVSSSFRRCGWRPVVGAALLVSLLTGCSLLPPPTEDPTRYYVLGDLAEPVALARNGTAVVGLRTVELPSYLRNTKSLVIRRGANEVRFDDFSRWAEPLEAGVTRILREQLGQAPSVRSVSTLPFVPDEPRTWDVRVRISRCEGGYVGNGRQSVLFSASYEISRADESGEVLVRGAFVAPEAAWDGKDAGELTRLLSEAVARLGADIAQKLPVAP